MGELCDRRLVDPALAEQREHDVGEVGVGFWRAATRLCGIVPAEIVAEEELVAEPGIERPQDQVGDGVVVVAPDVVVLDPGTARRDRLVEREVGLRLGVDRNEAARPSRPRPR